MKKALLFAWLAGMAGLCLGQQLALRGTTPLPVGLRAFSSVTLPDGDILVFGGSVNAVEATGQSWRYDWKTETWSPAPPLAYPAAQMQVARLSDGNILAVGGTDDFTGEIQTSQLLDVATMEWTASAGNFESLLDDYTRHSVVTLPGDYVLLTTSQGEAAVYDPATTQWAVIEPGPLDAGGAPAFWLEEQEEVLLSEAGGQIYIPNDPPHTGNLFYLDPAQPLFQDGAVKLDDGRILTMDLELNFDTHVSIYNPATRTAEVVTMLPFNAGLATRSSIVMADGRVLSFGAGDLTAPGDTKLIQVYHPATNEWEVGNYSDIGPFSTPQMHLLPDNSIFAISGVPEPNPANETWIINREQTTSAGVLKSESFRLSPNPASGWLQVDHRGEKIAELLLFTTTGKLAARWENAAGRISLAGRGLAPGIYFYRLEGANHQLLQTGKIIIAE